MNDLNTEDGLTSENEACPVNLVTRIKYEAQDPVLPLNCSNSIAANEFPIKKTSNYSFSPTDSVLSCFKRRKRGRYSGSNTASLTSGIHSRYVTSPYCSTQSQHPPPHSHHQVQSQQLQQQPSSPKKSCTASTINAAAAGGDFIYASGAPTNKSFSCPNCQLHFSNRDSLAMHMMESVRLEGCHQSNKNSGASKPSPGASPPYADMHHHHHHHCRGASSSTVGTVNGTHASSQLVPPPPPPPPPPPSLGSQSLFCKICRESFLTLDSLAMHMFIHMQHHHHHQHQQQHQQQQQQQQEPSKQLPSIQPTGPAVPISAASTPTPTATDSVWSNQLYFKSLMNAATLASAAAAAVAVNSGNSGGRKCTEDKPSNCAIAAATAATAAGGGTGAAASNGSSIASNGSSSSTSNIRQHQFQQKQQQHQQQNFLSTAMTAAADSTERSNIGVSGWQLSSVSPPPIESQQRNCYSAPLFCASSASTNHRINTTSGKCDARSRSTSNSLVGAILLPAITPSQSTNGARELLALAALQQQQHQQQQQQQRRRQQYQHQYQEKQQITIDAVESNDGDRGGNGDGGGGDREASVFDGELELLSKLHKCHHCRLWFEEPTMFCLHMGLHNVNDPWQCNMCGKKCVDLYDFTVHSLHF